MPATGPQRACTGPLGFSLYSAALRKPARERPANRLLGGVPPPRTEKTDGPQTPRKRPAMGLRRRVGGPPCEKNGGRKHPANGLREIRKFTFFLLYVVLHQHKILLRSEQLATQFVYLFCVSRGSYPPTTRRHVKLKIFTAICVVCGCIGAAFVAGATWASAEVGGELRSEGEHSAATILTP